MRKEIELLKNRIEQEREEPLGEKQDAYFESIETAEDVSKFDKADQELVALAYDAALAMGMTKTQALVATGEAPAEHARTIRLTYREGEYLSGYTAYGEDAKLLEEIGIGRYVSGWGYYLNNDVVKKLGTEFEYRAAWELAQPAILDRKAFKQMEKERIEKLFAEASLTMRDVLIERYTEDCNDPNEECDIDEVLIYATPNGTRKVVRNHTW